jgi:hypothetical protein
MSNEIENRTTVWTLTRALLGGNATVGAAVDDAASILSEGDEYSRTDAIETVRRSGVRAPGISTCGGARWECGWGPNFG